MCAVQVGQERGQDAIVGSGNGEKQACLGSMKGARERGRGLRGEEEWKTEPSASPRLESSGELSSSLGTAQGSGAVSVSLGCYNEMTKMGD